MNRSTVVFFSLLFLVAAVPARAQVTQLAHLAQIHDLRGWRRLHVPTRLCRAWISTSNPQRLYGIGAFVDVDFTRWIQIEAEGRWLHWNEYAAVSENTYMIGPRVPIIEYKLSHALRQVPHRHRQRQFLNGSTTAMAFGGGLDYRLSKKLTVRGDYEYQDWRVGEHDPPWRQRRRQLPRLESPAVLRP